MAESLTGKLLVASPRLTDPNFHRSVVFLGKSDDAGAFGLIINRPTNLPVVSEIPDWEPVLRSGQTFLQGGPVAPASVIALGRSKTTFPSAWAEITAGVGIINVNEPPFGLSDHDVETRFFLGYAGWGAGQLEDEIAEEAWFVVDLEIDDIFTSTPELLWRAVLRRQSGKLAMFAYFPTDPALN